MRRQIGRLRPGRRLGRFALAAVLALLWLAAAGMPAGAHALLRESDPAAGSSVDRAPDRVVLTFTERPEPGLSSIRVLDSGGRQVERGQAALVQGSPVQLAVGLGDLGDGTYTVAWRVVSRDDGHVTDGAFAFGVGVEATATPQARAAPQGATAAPSVPATAARWALYAGLTLLVGGSVFGLAVSGRVLPAGSRTLLAVAAGLAVVGGAARFLAEQARIDAPLGTLLDSSTGQGLLRLAVGVLGSAVATWFLAAGLGPARMREPALVGGGPPEGEPSRVPDRVPAAVHSPPAGEAGAGGEAGAPVDAWRLALVGIAAGVTMLLHILVGHAAGPSPLRSVNLLVQWLHLLAVGTWIGGLVWLLAGLRGQQRPEQVAVAVRFSKLAAPVLGLVAVTGLSRALHLAGGWQGLLDSNYGHLLDVKVALFFGLVLLGALNRYRIVPALSGGVRRLDELRRNVRGEVVLAACILAVTAVLSQLPPGKFVVEQAAAKPPAPPSLQVEGSDFATSVRVALTVSPGTTGPNAFTAKVTDYDSGEDWPATRVALRFTPRDQPDIGASTLDLKRADDGLWRGQGSQLSIAGRWVVVGLIEGSGPAVTVPMELRTRAAPQQVKVSEVPGQPTLYTVTLGAGGSLQGYIDPGRPGPNTVHFTFFNRSGDEQPVDKGRARMTTSAGSEALTLVRLGPGHFAANIDLEPGRVSFAIDATAGRTRYDGGFQQLLQ
ncbi:MAG TPA: copper resistance protein CopC [Actinomycetes bacterium]|nr:copper resistance protein CopC [Actinomycetes bacterium]